MAASVERCWESLWYLHNETVNIWSHIAGALLFFALPIWIFNAEIPPRYAVATTADKIACSLYFIGVALCFSLSVIYHIAICHSPKAFALGLQLDFQGILILMWGANTSLIHYGFICDEHLRITYWSLTTFLAACCSTFTFQERFSDPHLRPLRAATFGSLALSTFIPVIHGLVKYGYDVQHERIALPWVLLTLLFNVLGASAYAAKVRFQATSTDSRLTKEQFPEKWFPRRFDIFGASHQIMHVMILIAAVMYGQAVIGEFDYRHAHPSQCLSG